MEFVLKYLKILNNYLIIKELIELNKKKVYVDYFVNLLVRNMMMKNMKHLY